MAFLRHLDCNSVMLFLRYLDRKPIQCSLLIMLCLGSIEIDRVISELLYKGTISQRITTIGNSYTVKPVLSGDSKKKIKNWFSRPIIT